MIKTVIMGTGRMGSLIRTTAEGIVDAAGQPVFDIVAQIGFDLSELENAPAADVIIDCVGAKPLFQQILDAAAKTSTVVIVGNYSENVELNVAQIQRNELNFLGNITYTRDDFETAIRLFEERKVYVEDFISARFSIEQIQEGMDQAVAGKAHNMKTIFDY